jgi:ABC-2 type transport system permease protein
VSGRSIAKKYRVSRHPVSTSIWTALARCLGILIVAYVLAMATYRRRITQ